MAPVQKKPFSQQNSGWVTLVDQPPPMCTGCTATLRKVNTGKTNSKALVKGFLEFVVEVECQMCRAMTPAASCNDAFVCQGCRGCAAAPAAGP